jgi:hypothetical protein
MATDAAKIRLADKPPVACASCHGQYVDRRHVDFGAAYDGPMLPNEEVAGGNMVSVDDLIVCEDCLKTAAAVIGLSDPADVQGELDQMVAQHEQVTERLAGAMAYINRLESANRERDTLEDALRPKRRAK